ncbi:unnamed protein product [Brachionus calyciflorus]|uniref:BHLH domain-containing protein n=1 Tax=Brachionus calyciflorus TaxID=104777 RepID=A0A813M9H5_9BILA|nr:unnamed protein product [Brachionus calyciflorus]
MLTGNVNLNDDLVIDSTDDLDDYCDDPHDFENSKSKETHSKDSNLNEDDKRKRRAIANSNERRRMQSINAGFQTLKNLIPHSNGEKLSKACILQRSGDYMQFLSREKEKLTNKLQIAIKLLESNGLLAQLQKEITLDETSYNYNKSPVKTECQKITSKRKSISSISSILKTDESRQLCDSTNKPSTCSKPIYHPEPDQPLLFKMIENSKITNDEEEVEIKLSKTRSNSIDQLIAAAAVTASSSTSLSPQSPASSCQASNSGEVAKKNLNLNTIFEAIKHVEGKNLEQTEVHKPPKKRKYTTGDLNECNAHQTQPSMCVIDFKQLNALSLTLNQNQLQPTQFAILTSNENKNSKEDDPKKNDKIIGLLLTST